VSAAQPRRIVILTADVGEGHLSAARALEAQLGAGGEPVEIETVNVLEVVGPVLRLLLRDAYRTQLRRSPWVFSSLFFLFLHCRPLRRIGSTGLALMAGRRVARALDALRPDVVVSTYPAATSIVGSLRRRRRLRAVACATITDLGAVSLWSHPGIDRHLVMHPSLVAVVEHEAGRGSACSVRPLVAPSFVEARSRAAARTALGLPAAGRVVVVSGGGWGVGDLVGAAEEARSEPDTTVVCLGGRDRALAASLRRHFAGDPGVRVLGFSDRMPELLAAADVLVHTTGGMTCLEALASGCPVVAYGAPPGHSPTLARAMDALGIAIHARSRQDLRRALAGARRATPPDGPLAGDVVLATPLRARPQRAHRPLRVALATSLLVALLLGSAASERAFALVSGRLDLAPVSALETRLPRVALVLEAPATSTGPLARAVAARGGTATFAYARPPGPRLRAVLAREGDDWTLRLRAPGVDDWLGTSDEGRDARSSSGRVAAFVVGPAAGPSLGQYLLARTAGARIVDGAHPYRPDRRLERGTIVVARLTAGREGVALLGAALRRIERRGLVPRSLGALA
jgi:UDP-N-acetylglucosamine:LPS N-acetylglucosamine transferase